MGPNRDFEVKRDARGREVMEVHVDGAALLRSPMTNKGTAFSAEERVVLKLEGLLPPAVLDLDRQIARVVAAFREAPSDLGKYQFLRALQDRNEVLFHAVLARHVDEMLPIVYTPTVGEAVRRFHFLYQAPRGASVSPNDVDRVDALFANQPVDDVRMIVATDSSAILGIGDQGYGGLAIAIGKLALYTAGGGVGPMQTMPMLLDVGTERDDLLADPLYLGTRQRRLRGDAYFAFLDKVVAGVKKRWPAAVVQWEDLSKDTAFAVLERYRKVLPSFNDDIQGTGAVTLAGVESACRLRGERLRDQRVVIHGAGAGGVGVAWAIAEGMVRGGLTREEARARIFVLDSKGLLVADRDMEAYKKAYAQGRDAIAGWPTAKGTPGLHETIAEARATVLLGLSGQAGAFDRAAIEAIAKNTARPVVFALSNPTASAEALPADVIAWSRGGAIVATGSPFDPVTYDGRTQPIGQGNNAFIFPGLGLGAILARVREVTDAMVLDAAETLVAYTREHHPALVYPPVAELRRVSERVAERVFARAFADGVATAPAVPDAKIAAHVAAATWKAEYLPFVRALS